MSTISRSFSDKFLLSIIEAHIPARMKGLRRQREREKRLFAARQALFNDGSRDKHIDDGRALFEMTQESLRDTYVDMRNLKRIRKEKPRSVRTLAREASTLAYGNSQAAIAQRLRSRFRGNNKKLLLNIERYRDDVDESIEYQVLENLRGLLQSYGVDMNLAAIHPTPAIVRKKNAQLASQRRP